jgi:uncharacterized membrane protein
MFSIKESFVFAWSKFRENLTLSLLTTLFMLAIGSTVKENGHFFAFIFSFAVSIFLVFIRIGYTKIFLRLHDGEKPNFTDIFKEYESFWRYLGVSILTGIAVVGGFLLLVIPGIIWAVRFAFAPIIVVDTKSGPILSMKESYNLTKGKFWSLLGFWVVIGLLNLLGFLIFIVGLLATIPISTLAVIYVYRRLTKTEAAVIVEPSPQVA